MFFNLPCRTHNHPVGQCSMQEMLYKLTIKFILSILSNKSVIIAKIGKIARSSALSPLDQNIAFIRHIFGIYLDSSLSSNLRRIRDI